MSTSPKWLLALLISSSVFAAKPADRCPSAADSVEARQKTVGYLATEEGLVCTGTLLSPQVVLTAAHCVKGLSPKHVSFSLSADPLAVPSLYAPAKSIVIHPEFSMQERINDLALVQLNGTSYSNKDAVTFFPLGGDLANVGDTNATVPGYGVDKKGNAGYRRTIHVRLGAIGEDKKLEIKPGDTDEVPCKGDSGAPILKLLGERTQIVGVFSQYTAKVKPLAVTAKHVTQRKAYLCRATQDTHAIYLQPYLEWLNSVRENMEPSRTDSSCP